MLLSICAGGPVDNWRYVLDLNVLGLSICTKEAIESMNEKQVDGYIININRSVTLQSFIDIPRLTQPFGPGAGHLQFSTPFI